MSVKRKNRNYYALTIIFAGVVVFALVFVLRLNTGPKLTALEQLIADGAPADHVHTLAAVDETTYAGTHLGLISRTGSGKWERHPTVRQDLLGVATAHGQLYVAGPEVGLAQVSGSQVHTLLAGDLRGVAAHPTDAQRLFAFVAGGGLKESRDGGKVWTELGALPGELLTLAIDPQRPERFIAGGLDYLAVSEDGGKSWAKAPMLGATGTISSLAFDPQHAGRLWGAISGGVWYSDNLQTGWRRVIIKEQDRIVSSIAFGPVGGPLAVTADGYLFKIAQ